MEKEILSLIHNKAMDEVDSIVNIEPNSKYEYEFCGYIEALYDLDVIDLDEYIKIKKHYRKYFRDLRKYYRELRNI